MIKVFSNRTDKPKQYGFVSIDEAPDKNTVGYHPVEIAVSDNATDWVSIYDHPDLEGVHVVDTPAISASSQSDTSQKLGINDGKSLVSSSFDQREIKMTLRFDSRDGSDSRLAYDALQRFLVTREPYWICFADFPERMYYVKVTGVDNTTFNDWGFLVEYTLTDQLGLSRSIGTTGNPDNYLLGFGNNELLTTPPQYSFRGTAFTLYNPSDIVIDPERRGHPFKMILEGSASGDMIIRNTTTATSITRKGAWSGKWVLDGVNPFLNDKNDGINTDHGIITLQIGDNKFEVSGFDGGLKFDYPVWWLS